MEYHTSSDRETYRPNLRSRRSVGSTRYVSLFSIPVLSAEERFRRSVVDFWEITDEDELTIWGFDDFKVYGVRENGLPTTTAGS